MGTRPFREGDTFATFQGIVDRTLQEIDSLNNEYVLKASQVELEEFYISKVTITPLVLDTANHYIESQKGTKLDVSHHFDRIGTPGERIVVKATTLNICIPYSGDKFLWNIQPSHFTLSRYPEIEIRDDVVLFGCTFADDSANPENLKSEIQRNIQLLEDAVANLCVDVDNHNRTAPATVRSALSRKRTTAQSAVGAIAALGIPLKQRSGALTYTVPTVRRVLPVILPAVTGEKFFPEPVLDQKQYEHILGILRSMSLVIERNPAAFTSLDEETIRTHFLLQLNGHYEGSATGETFNASGKTDILIRVENRNVFIAECKFWRGQKSYSEAIDQILGYLSWRDSKCALLIFNQTMDTSAVRGKMHETMLARSEYRKTLSHDPSSDSRYVLVKSSDPGREIQIATMVFDVPNVSVRN